MRFAPLAAAAVALWCCASATAQTAADDATALQPIRRLPPQTRAAAGTRSKAGDRLPIHLRARSVRGRPDLDAVAEGDVEFRRGDTVIGADLLTYDQPEDLASARGNVRVQRDGNVFTGPELQLRVQRFEGWFLTPEFEFATLGAGGRADRIDFIDRSRSRITNALYTSCPRDGTGDPAWVLKADRLRLDFEANEGIAENAELRFLGLPILVLPVMTFALTDERKSGWLPPSVNIDNRSGIELSAPYYWNIAPNRDATISPRLITRRGAGLDAEFRYLEPQLNGTLATTLLPDDRLANRARASLQWQHEGTLRPGLRYAADVSRVSDADWWRDFPDVSRTQTPRLLPGRGLVEQSFGLAGADGLAYLRLARWQVLQNSDALVLPPYQRTPQIGMRLGSSTAGPVEYAVETEFNRFTRPSGDPVSETERLTGTRVHALGSAALPWRRDGMFVVPKVSVNAAAYHTQLPFGQDADRSAGRVIPTFSTDAGLELERDAVGFGRALRQTLEPRVLYVKTPYRRQADLPNFDAAAKDFNLNSIFSENAFSGVDRVSDAHQLTAGVTTRLIDAASGAEALRLSLVQRYLLKDQKVTAKPDGTADGEPLEQKFSDVLLLGSTSVLPSWTLDASVQYNPDISRPVRSILAARYSPGPFRTVSATYRFARGLSEQLELGWQWPIWGQPSAAALAAAAGDRTPVRSTSSSTGCGGTVYAVGRVNYSMRDSRVTDSIAGFEYDAGCWVGRVVAERLSTGRSEATTRLLLQLELVGLSRLGSNPLKVLKDNIPGYKLLRDDRRGAQPTPTFFDD